MREKRFFLTVFLVVLSITCLQLNGSWIRQKSVEVFKNRQWYSEIKNLTKPAIVQSQRWHTARLTAFPPIKYKEMRVTKNTFHPTTAKPLKCRPIKFANPPLPITALVSFPGSGNTWFRHLLEVSTGYFTGSVYKDKALVKGGFLGENVTNGSVIAVKIHSPRNSKDRWLRKLKVFQRVILLIRDPVNASLAEINRLNAGHTGLAKQQKVAKAFPNFIKKAIPRWKDTYLSWLNTTNQIIVVRYEKLKSHLIGEMSRVFNFLNVSVSDEDVACMVKNSQGKFRRKAKRKPQIKLLQNMPKYVYETEKSVLQVLDKYLN